MVRRPIPNMRHYVLDPATLAPLPLGVFVSGPGLARGYIGRPDLTEAASLPNPFRLPEDSDAYGRMLAPATTSCGCPAASIGAVSGRGHLCFGISCLPRRHCICL